MGERWQDRSWIPDEKEMAAVADLLASDQGQVLMRLLDEASMFETAYGLLGRGQLVEDRDLAFAQGKFDAFHRVMSWLIQERDPESQEEEDG